MTILYILLILALVGAIKSATESARKREAIREAKRIEAMKRLAIVEREQARQQREQDRQRREQDRQRKEQERQAAQLAKHEAEIEKLKFSVDRYTADIDYLQQRIADLDARTDYFQALQSACNPGSSEWDKYQQKIIVLRGQANTAESRLATARWKKEQAEKKLA